jgi:hypothetical protein
MRMLPGDISAVRLPLISTNAGPHETISKLGSTPVISKPLTCAAVDLPDFHAFEELPSVLFPAFDELDNPPFKIPLTEKERSLGRESSS